MNKNSGMKIIFGVTLVLCWLFWTTAACAKDDMVMPGVPEIDVSEKDSLQISETIIGLKAAIEEDPENYEYYSMLAFVYNYAGMDKEALETLEKELEYYPGPDWNVLYYNIARAYMNMNQLEEGKVYLDKAMDYRPDNVYNNELLMEYSILIKDYRQAAIGMKILADLVPSRDWYYDTFTKFHAREDRNEYDFAALYKEALTENPDNHYAIRAYALMLRNKGTKEFLQNYAVIIKELKRAYSLKPDYVFHCVGIGNTYLWKWAVDKDKKDKKDLRQALKWMKKAQKLEPENPKVLFGLGNLYIYAQEEDKAIALLEKVMSLGMNDETVTDALALAYNNKAYDLYEKGEDLEKGISLIDQALIFSPEDGIILGTKAELLYKLGRYEQAHEYIKKAIALEPGEPEMQQDLENIEKALEAKKLK
ncbi:MAG: tetratricopeptide repeat protein [Candidatus Omnitrophota bacterium]